MRARIGDYIRVQPFTEDLEVVDRLFIEDGLTRVFCAGMSTSMCLTDKQYEQMRSNFTATQTNPFSSVVA